LNSLKIYDYLDLVNLNLLLLHPNVAFYREAFHK